SIEAIPEGEEEEIPAVSARGQLHRSSVVARLSMRFQKFASLAERRRSRSEDQGHTDFAITPFIPTGKDTAKGDYSVRAGADQCRHKTLGVVNTSKGPVRLLRQWQSIKDTSKKVQCLRSIVRVFAR
ncbi:hypothetical protein RvY_19320, partial [Ramazzottius varieornatus]